MSFGPTGIALFIAVSFFLYFSRYWPQMFLLADTSGQKPEPTRRELTEAAYLKRVRVMMQVAISVVMMAAALYIILASDFPAADKHWAYGTAGTVIGFWLKGA